MPENGVNRRTVLKHAAWSMPVLAVAVAAPAASASTIVVGLDLDGHCQSQPVPRGPAFRLAVEAPGVPAGTTIVLAGATDVSDMDWDLSAFGTGVVTGIPGGGNNTFTISFNTAWHGEAIFFAPYPRNFPGNSSRKFTATIDLPDRFVLEEPSDATGFIELTDDRDRCADDNSDTIG